MRYYTVEKIGLGTVKGLIHCGDELGELLCSFTDVDTRYEPSVVVTSIFDRFMLFISKHNDGELTHIGLPDDVDELSTVIEVLNLD
jgi:hypothetical protein